MKIEETQKKVITRFPPSPTGFLHLGSVRTALFNYLFAKKNPGGKMLLRVEDTDRERSKKEFELDMIESLRWLGLSWDNTEILQQSQRGTVYKKYLEKLIQDDKAYISKEEQLQEGDRAEVIRFRNPNKKIQFTDLIRGNIEFDTTELSDFVIAKSLEEPVYHLAVVIDDFESEVTHIIRGEDGISNTPRQILIQEAIGAPRPIYAHLPLILASDRSKLSKRKHGESVSINFYRERAYLPEAILNYLALLGWNPGTPQEIFSMDELINVFDISKIQKGGAIFNVEKLNWFNKHYIQKLTSEQKIQHLEGKISDEQMSALKATPKLIEVMTERISNFGELVTSIKSGEYDYFFGKPVFEKTILLWKGVGDLQTTRNRLNEVVKILQSVPDESFNRVSIKETLWPYAEKEGRGEVLWPTRVSLSGKEKSPDPFVLSELLGKKETLIRLNDTINSIT